MDRFYKRYLRQEELDEATQKMTEVSELFKQLPAQSIDWTGFQTTAIKTKMNYNGTTLDEVFKAYFEGFTHCAESAKLNNEAFKEYTNYQYEPVRLIVADQPWFMVEKNRPLSEYDNLEGKPFWLIS